MIKKKVKMISIKGLTAYMINKCSIHDGAKHFSSNGLQNYLVFLPNNGLIEYISKVTTES